MLRFCKPPKLSHLLPDAARHGVSYSVPVSYFHHGFLVVRSSLLNREMLDGLANSIDEAVQNDWADYSPEGYSDSLSHCRGPLASLSNPVRTALAPLDEGS
jgi:hypothetical protein